MPTQAQPQSQSQLRPTGALLKAASDLRGPGRVAKAADYTLTGDFPTRPHSIILLQRRTKQADWRQVSKAVSRRNGHFTFDLTASRQAGFTTYRAVSLAGTRAGLKTDPWRVETVTPGTWAQLSAGGHDSCGIKPDHTGWCWGYAGSAARGVGPSEGVREPRVLAGRWASITPSGRGMTCGIRLDSSGWCLGGYPGDGQESSRKAVRLEGEWRTLTPTSYFEDDSVDYTCGIRTDGSAWCWGQDWHGHLGIGAPPQTVTLVLTPHPLPGSWQTITGARTTQCGIRTDGTGWCWGSNYSGQVGNGGTDDRNLPTQVPGTWSWISPGFYGPTCGLQTDATAWCWGPNSSGQVGDGTATESRTTPYQLPGTWRSIDNSGSTVCGIRTDDTGWCWGENTHGSVGDGTTADRTTPYQLPGTWSELTSSQFSSTTCGVQTDRSGWCWGDNSSGSVGNGSTKDRLIPYRLTGAWTHLEPGFTTCGLRVTGTGWCWGANSDGLVGNGSFQHQLLPSRLPGRWSQIEGDRTLCGIRPDDTAACWGNNSYGQAGVRNKGDIAVPSVLP